jgi:hypothetical protein
MDFQNGKQRGTGQIRGNVIEDDNGIGIADARTPEAPSIKAAK